MNLDDKESIAARIVELNRVIVDYSHGDFTSKAPISQKGDEIDLIISCVNMLGEELEATTISRDFFSSIYDAVSEIMIVLDLNLRITNYNKTTENKLFREEKRGELISILGDRIRSIIKKELKTNQKKTVSFHTQLEYGGIIIPVKCDCSLIKNGLEEPQGYLIVAEDISHRIETERLVLRKIVETQGSEQRRLATDLHDSLGQELSVVKLLLSDLESRVPVANADIAEGMANCREFLDGAIQSLRNICFNLMPGALQKGSLQDALEELFNKLDSQKIITIDAKINRDIVIHQKEIEFNLYRIIQEFINNTIKHAKASLLEVQLTGKSNMVLLVIRDNGIGFDVKTTIGRGMGMSNLDSRVKAYNGKYRLESNSKGTKLTVKFPLQ